MSATVARPTLTPTVHVGGTGALAEALRATLRGEALPESLRADVPRDAAPATCAEWIGRILVARATG